MTKRGHVYGLNKVEYGENNLYSTSVNKQSIIVPYSVNTD